MKWDFCLGNPPYQAETVEQVSEANGQAPRKNVFQYFQMEADKIAATGSILLYIPEGDGFISLVKDCSNSAKSKSMTAHWRQSNSILMHMRCLGKRLTLLMVLRLY